MDKPEPESIRLAMDQAWRDHHHARDQTWKAVHMEVILAVGLVTVDAQFHNPVVTTVAALLVILASVFGVWISLHHRKLERRKFRHILNCEEALGLHRDDLIPASGEHGVALPAEIRFRDAFRLSVRNTAVFILRMHLAIMLFAILLVVARWVL